MMGGYNTNPGAVSATMTVTPEQALQAAQQYLDQQYPGYKTAEDADPFYGYYTIDIMKDGQADRDAQRKRLQWAGLPPHLAWNFY